MQWSRGARSRGALLLGVITLLLTSGAPLPTAAPAEISLDDLLPDQPADVQLRALKRVEAAGDRQAIPALIELLRFDLSIPVELPVGVLEKLSGQRLGNDWKRWVEWLETQSDIVPPPEFVPWKGRLMSLIDPEFLEWFKPGIPHRIRMEEIAWGGVAKDGIPALTNPRT